MSDKEYDHLITIVFIGDRFIGKSNLSSRYVRDIYSENRADFDSIVLRTKLLMIDKKRIKLEICDDINGKNCEKTKYSKITEAHGIVLAYSITDRDSFENLRFWLNMIERFKNEKMKMILIGTKCDDESRREVSTEEGKELASIIGVKFMEISAKNDINITEVFQTLTMDIVMDFD